MSRWFETRATAGQILAKIEAVEARMAVLEKQMQQQKVDMGKCMFAVGINQLMDVTAGDE